MGKKKRIKKRRRNKTVKPDDYYSLGPLELARFGELTVLRNNMTSEQFEKMQTTLADRFTEVCQEIDYKIIEIVGEVKKYSPTELLKFAYWEMASSHLGIKSETEVDKKKALSVRMVDYIQSIIASVQPIDEDKQQVTEETWANLKAQVSQLFEQLNMEYQFCRTAFNRRENPDFDIEFEEFYFKAQLYWCNVRGNRYLYHETKHFKDILTPHSDILKELFGITAEQLIEEVSKIQYALTSGLIDTTLEMKKFQKTTMDALKTKFTDKNILEEGSWPELMADVIKENDWEKWKNDLFGRFFGLNLFDLEKITNLPKDFLEELSWSQGQDTDFFSNGDYKGWPLRVWPIFKRPFIKLNNHYYCFELYNLLDNLYRVVERTICRIRREYRPTWNLKQKEVSEELPFKYFKILLPEAQTIKSVYYFWHTNENSSKKEWCEADGIIICCNHLFVVEVKAGAFTYTSPANDFPAYIKSLKNLVFKPAKQGRRFLEYLQSENTVGIFDSDHRKIEDISKKDFEHITICAVTLDTFTGLASQVQHLKKIGIDVGEHPIWSLSVDDLRVYSDIFDNHLIFLHFVEQRMRAFQSDRIKTDDELDHLGLYLKHNVYTEYAKDFKSDSPVGWHGYHSHVDSYFSEKLSNPQVECPLKQEMPVRLKEIIDFLAISNIPGRCKLSSLLLDSGGDLRDSFATGIDNVLAIQKNCRRPRPLTIYGGVNITLICWQDEIVSRDEKLAREHSGASMLLSDDDERLLLEIFYDKFGAIKDIEYQFQKRELFSNDEIEQLQIIAEKIRKRRLDQEIGQSGKIGRNSQCPCGSGKKYKKCCIDL